MNIINTDTTVNKNSDSNMMNLKAGKFNIIMDHYNFTDTSSAGAAVLTFQLNQTMNGHLNNQPIKADQSLNLQFGDAYFAVNNSANTMNGNTAVSVAPAIKDFNFTNVTNREEWEYPMWIDNMQDAYIFFNHFDNGTVTLDPEYGFGYGVETPGKIVLIIVVSVVGAVVVVAAVVAGCFIVRRRNQSKKNYQRF